MNSIELKKIRKNLRFWFKNANQEQISQGLVWYDDASQYASYLGSRFHKTKYIAAGVLAASSPQNKWERNKIDAYNILNAVDKNIPMDQVKVSTFNKNKYKAFEIAKGNIEILKSSPKTYAFARNIGAGDDNYVTIDRWHIRACKTTSSKPKKIIESVTHKQYQQIQSETIKVAKEFGVKPHQFQAIIWVTIRDKWLKK